MIFLAGLTIPKKKRCLGIVGGCGAIPSVVLLMRNAADYVLPTFGPHGTKLGQVNIVVAGVDGHMADDQVRTSSKVARGTPKWRSS